MRDWGSLLSTGAPNVQVGWRCKVLLVAFTESLCCGKCRKRHFALIERVSFVETANCLYSWRGTGGPITTVMVESHMRVLGRFLLGLLHLLPARAFAVLLLGLERRGRGSGGSVVVVLLGSTQRGAEQQVADPGFNEGEGRAVGVSSSHQHLEGRDVSQSLNSWTFVTN